MDKEVNLDNYLINENAHIKEALKKIDLGITRVLLVVDNEKRLKGTMTDGDVRRYLLKGNQLENTIQDVYNNSPVTLKAAYFTVDIAKILIIENKIDLLPLLDDSNIVIDIITRDRLFNPALFIPVKKTELDVPVVVMAGGKGTRMEPFTKILPKPLVPVGDTPILEIIMEEFSKAGLSKFFVTLNFRGEMIEAYFNHCDKKYDIEYIWEEDFYGTAGCLKLLQDKIKNTFIVSNCDVLVKANYEDVLRLHKEQEAKLTVLSSIQHYKIPYGIIYFKEGGFVTEIKEKPEYSFTINTGIYVLEPDVLQYIPDKQVFHMTDLMQCLINNGQKVITYPVNENEYVDIGQWEEYKKAMDKLSLLR
ncbi:MAG: nucleotidyltransferase family protein [Candidatus Margulisbacteria bacterium]|nr:nucleotidyltransferase family protein [Candidatus Margulisiibacteriota bacterium]